MPTCASASPGWTYAPWRGVFFPTGLAHQRELEYASRQVNTIEINGTFYSLQRPSSYTKWYEITPPGFIFSVKGSRFITHMKRLKDVEVPLANFFASGLLNLREKSGPLLWQLPPTFQFDPDRLAAFFDLLPRDSTSIAKLARKHDGRLKDGAALTPDANRPLRHALEVRHPTFECPEFIDLLREHDIAVVVADTARKWPPIEDVTAEWVYVRLHGDEELYVSGYSDAALDSWAAKIRAWSAGDDSPPGAQLVGSTLGKKAAARDVYVYFDNDVKVHAPYDAISLARRLSDSA